MDLTPNSFLSRRGSPWGSMPPYLRRQAVLVNEAVCGVPRRLLGAAGRASRKQFVPPIGASPTRCPGSNGTNNAILLTLECFPDHVPLVRGSCIGVRAKAFIEYPTEVCLATILLRGVHPRGRVQDHVIWLVSTERCGEGICKCDRRDDWQTCFNFQYLLILTGVLCSYPVYEIGVGEQLSYRQGFQSEKKKEKVNR